MSYYAAHQPVIECGMRECPETFKRGITFALLSIRQAIENVPPMLADVEERRTESVYLFGFKRDGYRHAELRGRELWARVCAIPKTDPAGAIVALAEVPGLGVVKAGFVAQMLGFDVACLDSRNVAREGLKPRAWRTDGRRVSRRKAEAYVRQTGGRAQELWDTWCDDVAAARGRSGEEVSALHLAIVPDNYIPF